jgi:site-specific recombinase XerD
VSLLQAKVDVAVIALWLGHADIRSTDAYINPVPDDVVQNVLAHYRRQAGHKPRGLQPAPGYRAETLAALFGREHR